MIALVFVAGLVIGGGLGILAMALVAVAGRGDYEWRDSTDD